ncbi:aldo/keto reductase [Streptomyces sp. 5-10]|uniref:aldo/keto reductase n=1 Tax=Streptomyces sp. 5-10 TaxID=878925 RepID=UPI00351A0D97
MPRLQDPAGAFGDPEAERDEARDPLDLYVEHGGNFIDTANTYTNGSSERLLGESTRGNRESLVSRMQAITRKSYARTPV